MRVYEWVVVALLFALIAYSLVEGPHHLTEAQLNEQLHQFEQECAPFLPIVEHATNPAAKACVEESQRLTDLQAQFYR